MVSSTGSHVESVVFQRVVGSLGGGTAFEGDGSVGGSEGDVVGSEHGGLENTEVHSSGHSASHISGVEAEGVGV